MTQSQRILIVDDDPRICRLLARYLANEGFDARTASNGEDMHRQLVAARPHLVIMDLVLPEEDGFTLTREVQNHYDIPVIMLTGKDDTVEKVVGLELGADDYITKPFDQRELLARVRVVLRRYQKSLVPANNEVKIANFNNWVLNLSSQELLDPQGQQVHLTTHEFQLLAALVNSANRVLNRDQLMDLINGRDWNPVDRSIDVLVGKVRKKLRDNPRSPSLIKTVRGEGYMLTAVLTYQPSP
ncbi:MAG: response regulator [Candidatus Competibacterales bacterium]